MAVNLSPVGGVAAQFFTSTGAVLTGGKLYTYAAGTTTPAVTYTTSQGNTAWTNPIVLDSAGRVSGSGEIWLTDGIIYKFVLKDSNDVLIATYDNITGINSNSVAYTNQQEIVTATAGQTVFTLPFSYQPATNSLSVFVDGVNQYGPSASYAYVETDANTVTFNSGLHVGAEVKFTTTQQQGAGAVDASQVTYDPPFTGSVATNVEAKLAQTVSVKDFGATGDGSTDDTAAIQAAINSLPSANVLPCLVFEGGKRYRISDAAGSSGNYALNFDRAMIVQGNGATLVYTGDARAILLDANDSKFYDLLVKKYSYSTSGATSALTGTGWAIHNCFDNKFYNCLAEGFSYGFSFYGSGSGCSYHELYSCIALNNNINASFQNDSVSNSYCTNICWFGGRAEVQSTFSGGYATSKGISIPQSAVGSGCSIDGIRFYGTTVEGNAEVKVYCGANWCTFQDLYYDVHGPIATNDIVITASAQYINIIGGDALNFQTISNSGSHVSIFDGGKIVSGGTLTAAQLVDISASGAGQIQFPATQNASTDANTLDDYEESFAWSPTIDQLVNFTGTPTIADGYYTKVGNLVHVQGIISGTVTSGSTLTSCRLTLPFVQKAFPDGATGMAISNLNGVMGYTSDYSDGTAGTMQVVFPAASGIASGACSIRFSLTYCANQ